MGDREGTLRGAVRELKAKEDIDILQISAFYETEPVGGPPQGTFINAAAEASTLLPPRPFLQALHDVEDMFGRERRERWGPRTLDLDLLLYDDCIVDEPDLQVPHPRMHRRRFVLEPLCELCPDREHPRLEKTIRQLLAELDEGE